MINSRSTNIKKKRNRKEKKEMSEQQEEKEEEEEKEIKKSPLIISNSSSLILTHELRNYYDSILIGVNTLNNDNPSLNCRFVQNGINPKPIILDNSLRINEKCKLLNDEINCEKPIIIINKDKIMKNLEKLKKFNHLKSK